MKRRWNPIIAAVLGLSLPCHAFPEEEAAALEVEAEIDIGVTAELAEEAMKVGDAANALILLLEAVVKHPQNVTALKKYYDFLLKNRVKLDANARGAALEQAQMTWPQAKRLEDVFLFLFVDGEIQQLLHRIADEGEDSLRAFEQIESLLRRNDLKKFAFYFYIAAVHPDKMMGQRAHLRIAELLLRRGDYRAARWQFVWNTPSIFVSRELHERGKLGLAKCREHLGKTEEAIRDYMWVWQGSESPDARLFAAERIARMRLAEGRPAHAFSWCLRIKAKYPTDPFMCDELRYLYSTQMKRVGQYAGKLAPLLEQYERVADEEVEETKLVALLRGITRDDPNENGTARASKLRVRGLLILSADILDLLQNPTPVVRKAQELGYVATSLWLDRRFPSRPRRGREEEGSQLRQVLLPPNDDLVESAFAEALATHGSDGRNAARLACAYLYFVITRDGGGRPQLGPLVSSLSDKIKGVGELYSSREVTEAIGSVSRAARVFERVKAEYRAFVKRDIAAARDAEGLAKAAAEAQATGNHDLTVMALKRIQKEYPDQTAVPGLAYMLAEAHYYNRDYDQARRTYKKYVQQDPKDQVRRKWAEYLAARCDFDARDYRAAAVSLFEFAQNNPTFERIEVAVDLALKSCSRFVESREVSLEDKKDFLSGLIRRFPKTKLAAGAHYQLGRLILNSRNKDYPDALKHFQAALSGRRSEEAGYYIGICCQNLGELDNAEKWYLKVIRESRYEGPRKSATRALENLKQERKRKDRSE